MSGALIDIELVHLGLAGLLSGDFLDHRAEHAARAAPCREEIHKNGDVGLQNLLFEIRRSYHFAHVPFLLNK